MPVIPIEVVVKLNAPPPPPPPPPEPGEPGPHETTPPGPTDATAPPTEPGAPPAAPKPATWPAWFPAADFALALLAVGLAFLLASFVARNSDVWLHLAAGKRLLAGEYTPGSDPFSYTAADRAWVNHSWLLDAGAYLLYSGNGAVLVVLKALAVALTFGLLIGIRRPGFALWPWAAVAAVAAVAAAPRLALAPHIGSMLLLAVTLFLLFRVPHRPGSWRFPVAIGVVFWVWANVDAWFILGPLALALVLVGELIQGGGRKADGESASAPRSDDGEPLGRLPDVPTLVRALAIGVLACMLNPHHVRVWELPFELIGSKAAMADPRLKQFLFSPLDKIYWDNASLGYNVNGLAYAALFFGGLAAFGLGAGRVRAAHVALWVGFALVSLLTAAAVPFFAVVAVPILASQLNALSARVSLKSWGDPKTRFVLLGSGVGRVACLAAVVVACVVAWPGWMHPGPGGSPFARRVGWAVEPDPAMARAAEQLQAWRADGRLGADARGVITSVELANYCAWFAPLEKVYLNGRFNHHRAEIPGFVAVRSGLGLFPREEPPTDRERAEVLKPTGAEYVVVHAGPGDLPRLRALAWGTDPWTWGAVQVAWLDADHWAPWYLDGRTAVLGWRTGPGAERPTFAALRVDPVALAFGPGVERLPPGSATPPPPQVGWEGEFFRPTPMPPAGADEVVAWFQFWQVIRQDHQRRQVANQIGLFLGAGSGGGWPVVVAERALTSGAVPAGPTPDAGAATAFLGLRAARRAIASSPDHPDGYFALFLALNNPDLPVDETDRAVGQVTALRQCLIRMPPPERFRRGVARASPVDVARNLARLYLGRQTTSPPGSGLPQSAGVPVLGPAFAVLSPGVPATVERDKDGRERAGPSALPQGAVGYLFNVRGQLVRLAPDQAQQAAQRPAEARQVGGPHLLALDLAYEAAKLADQYAQADPEPGEEGRQLAERTKALAKDLEDELAKANTSYQRARAQPQNQKLDAQVQLALRFNLVGEALQALNDPGTDFGREFGPRALGMLLARTALELATGRLEDAAGHLDATAQDPVVGQARSNPVFGRHFLQISYQRLFLEGDYGEAGKVVELFADEFARDPDPPPGLDPRPLAQAAPTLTGLSLLTALAPPLMLGEQVQAVLGLAFEPFAGRQQAMQRRREGLAQFYYRRGLLFLLQGDIPEARRRFEMAPQKGDPDWGVRDAPSPAAERYLRLIAEAEKAGK